MRWECYPKEETRFVHIMVLVAMHFVITASILSQSPGRENTYLRTPIAPGDIIIGNGVSRLYFSHLLANARKVRPCATYPPRK